MIQLTAQRIIGRLTKFPLVSILTASHGKFLASLNGFALYCVCSVLNHILRTELLNLQEAISIRAKSRFPHFLCLFSFFISFLVRLHSNRRPMYPD